MEYSRSFRYILLRNKEVIRDYQVVCKEQQEIR